MAYIGNDPSNRFVAPKAASVFSGDGSTTAFTLDHAVGSDEDILVSVDGVIQEPSVAYAVSSGTTLTFTAAPSSNSGNNIFVYYLFRTVGTVSHPSNNALSATSGTFSGVLKTDDTTEATSTTDGSLQTDGGLSVAKDAVFGDDIKLLSDSSVIHLGTDSDVFLQHSHNDGLNLQRSADGTVTFNIRRNDTATADGNILASINVSTPNNSSGTDALLVNSGIDFRAGANFAADKNAGEVDIKCANSETAATVTTFKRHTDGSMEQVNVKGKITQRTEAGAGVNGITILASDDTTRIDTSKGGTSSHSHMRFANTNGFIGSISTSGTSTAFNTSSDYRLKENINYDWDGSTELKKLKPAKFNFKADSDTTVQGFIAHEVSDIVPEAINGTKDEKDADGNAVMQGIDQSKLVPLLVKSLQEALAEIDTLKTKVAALENA
jgi:hypothetical protein